ncbi:MAG: right-handed parallel beta-helix repeat-containing protein [Candidatus Latescibacterota bacterium]
MWRTLAALVLSASSALAANLYVDANNPEGYATIGDAVRRAQAGDVIYISEGFYAEQVSLGKKVSLIGEGADRVIVSYAQSGNAIDVSATVDSTAHLEGMTIIAKSGVGVAVAQGGGITLRSCTIRGCGQQAVNLNTSASVVQLCQLAENANGALYTYGDQGSIITNNVINGNGGVSTAWGWTGAVVFHDNPGRAIFANNLVKGSTGSVMAAVLCAGGAPSISNNVITANSGFGIAAYYGGSGPAAPTITSNIVMGNSIGIEVQSATPVITYNDVVDNTSADYSNSARDDMGGISQDPEFVNANTGDYHLRDTSPCIDAGVPGAANADPDGSRNDMGIYGGPYAAFWVEPYTGPVVTSLEVSPSSVQQGGTITVRATGTTVRD